MQFLHSTAFLNTSGRSKCIALLLFCVLEGQTSWVDPEGNLMVEGQRSRGLGCGKRRGEGRSAAGPG